MNPTTSTDVADGPWGIAPDGHRLSPSTRLGPVRLQVADLERSVDYYRSVLGLAAIDHGAGTAVLAPQGDERALVVLEEGAGVRPVPPHGRLGLYHFAILLPTRSDLGRFLRHLSERGMRAGASDHAVSEALYLRDPDGLGIEVYADRPRSAWQTTGRELRMGTDPLDVAAVLRAGGDEPWRGMPVGTEMGHVHLHVSDLREAAGFFHQGLGLDKVVWSYPGALFLSAGGYHHHLGLNTWTAGAPPAGDGDARLLEWTVEGPDANAVSAATAGLAAAGYTAEASPRGDRLVRDPWGTGLRIREAAPRAG